MDDRKHAVCEGLSGSTRSAATLYQRASLRITPDKSRKRTCSGLVLHLSGKRCQLNRSTQHFLEVYSQEFESLGFFLVVDLSAALLCPVPTVYSRTGRFP